MKASSVMGAPLPNPASDPVPPLPPPLTSV
jgi:hypothetical protein